MNDRELLELAAKAARIEVLKDPAGVLRNCTNTDPASNIYACKPWNPLADDGDALRLAVNLNLLVFTAPGHAVANACYRNGPYIREVFHVDSDDVAATRRAITRAAAEIGRSMK